MTAPPRSEVARHAAKFAALALAHTSREYPNKLDHILLDASDVRAPRTLHPVFFGSYDWHSCVHAYWLLARTLRRVPTLDAGRAIVALFDERFTPRAMSVEVAYASHPSRAGFERPYGWAWLLMLAAELARHDGIDARRWSATLQPLADVFERRFLAFLPKATYPIRVGTHYNTAFAIVLAHEYATTCGRTALREALEERARRWYADDRDCQAWEPGGDDFLSSALVEAECMRRVLPHDAFPAWRDAFLPRLAAGEPATLFSPAVVSDRTDGKIAHLDGLNLSRAWCWRALASTFDDDARRALAHAAAEQHLAASLPHVAGDYMGEHWLATFAMLAIDFE